MLLRGVYTFEPRPEDHDHTLPFTCNDTLIFLEVLKRDPNWLRVADIYGRVGYVPKIFVEPDEDYQNTDHVKSFLVDAVIKARQNKLSSAFVLELLRDEIRENPEVIKTRSLKMLKAFKEEDEEGKARRTKSDHHLNKKSSHRVLSSKEQLRRCSSIEEVESQCKARDREIYAQEHLDNQTRSRRNSAMKVYNRDDDHDDHHLRSDRSVRTALEDSGSEEKEEERNDRNVKQGASSASIREIKTNLVNVIQRTSGLNPKLSENILNEVFQQITEKSHSGSDFLKRLSSSSIPIAEENGPLHKLMRIMERLSKLSKEGIRRDGRKRKPPLPSSSDLDRLRKLLIECDPLLATQKLEHDHHSFSQDLVHLYHMESPEPTRERMLDIFLIISSLDKNGRGPLLLSKLPIYLARELMSMNSETKIFAQVLDLLTTLLSCGEPMPDSHFQVLGTGFINFLLRDVEDTFAKSCENEYDKISAQFSALIKLILAYNLQFTQKENIVLRVIAEKWTRPRGFITVIIDLFKRGTDPLCLERDNDFFARPTHSVFKMVADICLCQKTVAYLTQEDRSTLVNSIIDGLCEQPAGTIRIGYLQVLRALLGNVQQSLKEVRTVLLSILLETDPLAISEQQMIRQISREYPALFLRTISRIKTNVSMDTDGEYNGGEDDNASYLSS